MARIRSIHPALFTDEAFAGLSMPARVLLLGLWTEADDQGVFDWKPVTLKMRVMPVDNVDVPALLSEIAGADVIRRFEVDGKAYGVVRNFCKFQRPKTPKYRAFLPAELQKYAASTYENAESTSGETHQFPQNGEINIVERDQFPQKEEMPSQRKEEGGRREEEKKESRTQDAPDEEAWLKFLSSYPRRKGGNPVKPARRKFLGLVKTGTDPELLIAEAVKLNREMAQDGKVGTPFIPQMLTWLNQERFADAAAQAMIAELTNSETSQRLASQCYIKTDTPQWRAWCDHEGRSPPTDRNGGWYFPTEYPPGHEAAA